MFDSFNQRKDIFIQGNMSLIQKFRPRKYFGFISAHTQLSDSNIKLHFTWNLHKTKLFVCDKLQHFEEFVKPGKKLIIHGKIKAFY